MTQTMAPESSIVTIVKAAKPLAVGPAGLAAASTRPPTTSGPMSAGTSIRRTVMPPAVFPVISATKPASGRAKLAASPAMTKAMAV
jgi:hypothetical protein